jgi:hypothetical protein
MVAIFSWGVPSIVGKCNCCYLVRQVGIYVDSTTPQIDAIYQPFDEQFFIAYRFPETLQKDCGQNNK